MKAWITQLRKGLLEFCVLKAVCRGETYGYQLVQRLKSVEQLAVSESTVYPILTRLKQDGYVKVRDAPSSSGPPRRYYSLTSLGRHRIAEMNAYWEDLCVAITGLQDNCDRRTGDEKH